MIVLILLQYIMFSCAKRGIYRKYSDYLYTPNLEKCT